MCMWGEGALKSLSLSHDRDSGIGPASLVLARPHFRHTSPTYHVSVRTCSMRARLFGSCSHLSWHLATAAAERTRRSPTLFSSSKKKWAPRRLLLMPVWNSCLRDVMYQIKPFSQITCPFHIESEMVTETTKQRQWTWRCYENPSRQLKHVREINFLHFVQILSALHINLYKTHTHTHTHTHTQ